MSDDMWYAQRGQWEEEMRRQHEAAKAQGWEAEYEEFIDSLDEEPYGE